MIEQDALRKMTRQERRTIKPDDRRVYLVIYLDTYG